MLPGLSYGGYVKIEEIIKNKVLKSGGLIFEYKDNKIFVNEKPIQGLRIIEPSAWITGIHYTSWENATQIRSTKRIEPSPKDPFVYLSEPGKMSGWPEEWIKKELGASSANTEIRLSIIVLIEDVWLKASRDIVHFAIAGPIIEENINNLSIHKRKSSS